MHRLDRRIPRLVVVANHQLDNVLHNHHVVEKHLQLQTTLGTIPYSSSLNNWLRCDSMHTLEGAWFCRKRDLLRFSKSFVR